MQIKTLAAAGALGLGMGFAGLIGGTATASADQCGQTPTGFTPTNIACVTNANISEFARTTSPQYNLDVLVNGTKELVCSEDTPGQAGPGTCAYENSGLGLRDQLGTFASSVQDFFSGPKAPDPAPLSENETP